MQPVGPRNSKQRTTKTKDMSVQCSSWLHSRKYHKEGDGCLCQIVTGDQLCSNNAWNGDTYTSSVKVKAKQTLSWHKIMASVFWDRQQGFCWLTSCNEEALSMQKHTAKPWETMQSNSKRKVWQAHKGNCLDSWPYSSDLASSNTFFKYVYLCSNRPYFKKISHIMAIQKISSVWCTT